jgi:hypothetical protein
MMADSMRGPWKYAGDVGSKPGHTFDPHSPDNYVTKAQASAVVEIAAPGGEVQYIWWVLLQNVLHSVDVTLTNRLDVDANLLSELWIVGCRMGNQWNSGLSETPPGGRMHDLLYWTVLKVPYEEEITFEM